MMLLVQRVLILALATLGAQATILPGQGFLPGGNLRNVDNGGPYNLSLLTQQAVEVQEAIAAKQDYTDADLMDFVTNTECLEGLFDTWGVFGRGFNGDLTKGGPTPIGARMANLSHEVRMHLAEVALNEQAHALFARQAGSVHPCPLIDLTGGWNKWMAAAFDLGDKTVKEVFGEDYDPFKNDQNFCLSMLILEELGATGNKGLISLFTNPVLANGVAGLATSATAHATIERMLLWKMRNMTVHPFGETVQQVFARASALRDSLDGAPLTDQGLTNTDPRFIAVPYEWVNMVPTDVRGLTLDRTPQKNINILTLGNPEGKGVFFPEGIPGRINKPTGFDQSDAGTKSMTPLTKLAGQETVGQVGEFEPPLTGPEPATVNGYDALTQGLEGPLQDTTYKSRGYKMVPSGKPNFNDDVVVVVPENTQKTFLNLDL